MSVLPSFRPSFRPSVRNQKLKLSTKETRSTKTKPTRAKPNQPKPTKPKSSKPKPTKPKPTQPKPTQPKQNEPKQNKPKQNIPKQNQPKQTGTGSGWETDEISASRALDKTAGTEKRGEHDGAGPGPRILDFWGFPGRKKQKSSKNPPPWEVLFLLFSLQGTLFPAPISARQLAPTRAGTRAGICACMPPMPARRHLTAAGTSPGFANTIRRFISACHTKHTLSNSHKHS